MGALDEEAFTSDRPLYEVRREGLRGRELYRSPDLRDARRTNDDGRWTHDGEKFIDGVYRVQCLALPRPLAFRDPDCPRCHRAGGLAEMIDQPSRLAVPKRCPERKGTELTDHRLCSCGRVRTGEGGHRRRC